MNKRIGLILTLCSVLAVAGAGEANAAAGQFQFVAGEVKVLSRAGVERVARKGMDVEEGDTVSTIAGASAQIRMVDGGFIAVRPDSRLKVETFVFNGKQDGRERSLIMLLKGGFRAITGLIGNLNKQNYLIRTPSATIGIRGTDHEPMFIPEPLPGVAAIGVPGTYDRVNHGAAFIKTDLGIVNINPNQVGFVAGADKIPQLLPKIPEFYKPAPEKTLPAEKSGADVLQKKGSKPGTLRDGRDLTGQRAPAVTLTAPVATLKDAPLTSTTLIAPTTLLIAPTTTLIAPTTTTTTTSTTTLIAPTTSTTSTTTLIAPTTTTTSTTTLIAPITSTTTLIAPTTTTTTTTPTTTLIAPTTLTAPTTTLIAPTTLTAPTTTLITPTTTTIKLAP